MNLLTIMIRKKGVDKFLRLNIYFRNGNCGKRERILSRGGLDEEGEGRYCT